MKKLYAIIIFALLLTSLTASISTVKAQTVPLTGIDSGLVGYWRFNGNALDSSGNGNDGVVTGASYLTGKYQQGLSFDGSNDYLDSNDNVGISGSANRTLAFWCNVTTVKDSNIIGWGSDSTLKNFDVSIYSGGHWYLWSFVTDCDSGIDVQVGVMQFHVLTYDGSKLNWWINNVKIVTDYSIALDTTDSPLFIGRFSPNWGVMGYSNILIDEVRVYNRVLSNQEIQELYTGYFITATYDLGSTITPNGTINVGVDQEQQFTVGAALGYFPWTMYINNIGEAPNPYLTLNNVHSNETVYVTSQYTNSANTTVNYTYIILLMLFTFITIYFIIKPISTFNIVIGIALIAISFALATTGYLGNLWMVTFFTVVIGIYCMLRATDLL